MIRSGLSILEFDKQSEWRTDQEESVGFFFHFVSFICLRAFFKSIIKIIYLKKMKLFQLIQKNLSTLGIDSHQSKCSWRKLMMTWLIFGLTITSSVLFLIFKAKTFEEFTNNIYITSGDSMLCIDFAIVVFKREKLFKLINDFEKFVNISE